MTRELERPGSAARRAGVAIGHIGLTVADLDRAVAWYSEVLGFEVLMPPTGVKADDSFGGRCASEVFGDGFAGMRQAQLVAENGVGLELFQFTSPTTPVEQPSFSYLTPGLFHLCVEAREIDALVQRIATSGGRQRTAVHVSLPGEPYRWCYCEDPFGNVVEVYSHSHREVFGGSP